MVVVVVVRRSDTGGEIENRVRKCEGLLYTLGEIVNILRAGCVVEGLNLAQGTYLAPSPPPPIKDNQGGDKDRSMPGRGGLFGPNSKKKNPKTNKDTAADPDSSRKLGAQILSWRHSSVPEVS